MLIRREICIWIWKYLCYWIWTGPMSELAQTLNSHHKNSNRRATEKDYWVTETMDSLFRWGDEKLGLHKEWGAHSCLYIKGWSTKGTPKNRLRTDTGPVTTGLIFRHLKSWLDSNPHSQCARDSSWMLPTAISSLTRKPPSAGKS